MRRLLCAVGLHDWQPGGSSYRRPTEVCVRRWCRGKTWRWVRAADICGACGSHVEWCYDPDDDDGWWAHQSHPDDGHDAEPSQGRAA